MRWILVFIILYLIPLTVLFRNYKKFSRACIYGCMYVVLATTLVISNMYISGIKKIEQDTKSAFVVSYNDSDLSLDKKHDDLLKIKHFKRDVRDIEDIALNPIKDCVSCTKDIQTYLKDLDSVEKKVEKAMYMCGRVIEIYDDMEVPQLSQHEDTQILEECLQCVKEAYEMKYKAVEQVNLILNEKNTTYIPKVKQYINNSDQKLNQYKSKISNLEKKIENS